MERQINEALIQLEGNRADLALTERESTKKRDKYVLAKRMLSMGRE